MASTARLSTIFVSIMVVACDGGTELARAIDVDADRRAIVFATPVVVTPGPRSLCFEFARPGDSQLASQLAITLLDSAGAGEEFRGTADRTGEGTVCLRDSVSTRRVHIGATIASPRRLTIRRISLIAPGELRTAP